MATITGTWRSETLIGTLNDDVMYGQAGDDTVEGRAGNDLLFGGSGDDFLWGQAGNDQFEGNAGADRLFGGAGDDFFVVYGDRSAIDKAWGGRDDDTFDISGKGTWSQGESGNDRFLLDDPGQAFVTGGADADTFSITAPDIGRLNVVVTDYTAGEDVLDLTTSHGDTWENIARFDVDGDGALSLAGDGPCQTLADGDSATFQDGGLYLKVDSLDAFFANTDVLV